jgi:hypothetical protein
MFERILIGLHGGAMVCLAAILGVSLLLGRGLELLPLNHGAGPWLWLASWACFALLFALPRRPLVAWRFGLWLTSLALAGSAGLGVARHSPLALQVGAGAAALAIACVALAIGIGSANVRATRLGTRGAATPAVAAVPLVRGRRLSSLATRGTPWVVCASTFAVFFAWARASSPAVQGMGHAGMLVTFFLMLPGACVNPWFPRAGAMLWSLSLLLLGRIVIRSHDSGALLLTLLVSLGALALVARHGKTHPERVPA